MILRPKLGINFGFRIGMLIKFNQSTQAYTEVQNGEVYPLEFFLASEVLERRRAEVSGYLPAASVDSARTQIHPVILSVHEPAWWIKPPWKAENLVYLQAYVYSACTCLVHDAGLDLSWAL